MTQKTYIGIDPGLSGGIAVLDASGALVECYKMPSTPQDIYESLRKFDVSSTICYIENVGNGMPNQSSKATATFARHIGHLEMALIANGISTVKVSPVKWQKRFNIGGKSGETKTSHKNRIKAWAQQRFPNAKVALWGADALAIASYGYEDRK